MSKQDKKLQKLRDEIQRLEISIRESLSKKSNGKSELNLSKVNLQIHEKQKELNALSQKLNESKNR